MNLPHPRHGTVVAYIALIVAMGGTASAVTVHESTAASFKPFALNVANRQLHQGSPCAAKTTTLATRTFTVNSAGFYDAHLDLTVATTAKITATANGFISEGGPGIEWTLDGAPLDSVIATPHETQNGPTIHLAYAPGSSALIATVWLKPGRHVLKLSAENHPLTAADHKANCYTYTDTYSNLHATVSNG
jgi:hypothetical protein